MISLIASDMDGTLLTNNMTISPKTVAAIKSAHEHGIEFMVATGRGLSEARPLLTEHGLTPSFITLNGARVFNEHQTLVVNLPLSHSTLQAVVDELEVEHFYFELVTDQGIFSNSRIKRIENIANVIVRLNPDTPFKLAVQLTSARLELMHINYVDDYQFILNDSTYTVLKIIVFSEHGQDEFTSLKTFLATHSDLVVTSSSSNNIEINSIKAQKGLALAAYAEQKGLTMDHVMAIGDNLNDASMIKAAKYGVAMGNAIPLIKELAQKTTATNNEDGVADAIYWAIRLNHEEILGR